MKSFTGKHGKVYRLEDNPLGQGGEGAVYAIKEEPNLVAKLYHPHVKFKTEADRRELLEKIETMYAMKIRTTIDGILRVAWVKDILFDQGTFVGYVMPRVTVPYKIFQVTRDDRVKIFPTFTWKYSVQYAYNLSWVVWYLHMNDIIIGDMNMNNIAVGPKGEVVLIDCDSFDIRNKKTGRHHKCTVGLQELLAPELQMVGKLADATFTKESDNFSLAIHIFRLLMNNADPFGAKVLGHNTDSASKISANHAILNGECPHFRSIPLKKVPDWAPKLEFLPPDIVEAFNRTFNYTQTTALKNAKNRTTAEEWNRLLLKYAQPEPNPNLQTCPKDAAHVYPIHHTTCPFCTTQKKSGFFDKIKGLFGGK